MHNSSNFMDGFLDTEMHFVLLIVFAKISDESICFYYSFTCWK